MTSGVEGRDGRVLSRRALLLLGGLAGGAAAGLTGCARPERPDLRVTVDVDRTAGHTDPFALGIGCSTYGATPVEDQEQAEAERRLDARSVRLPVGWRRGRLASSATGGPADLDVRALVDRYRSWGYRVLVVLGGRTNDHDLAPGDAARIVRALGGDMLEYSTPNEPDALGGAAHLRLAERVHAEAGQVLPGVRLWGPAWAKYERRALDDFAGAMGPRLAGVDYHRYGMGERSVPTGQLLADTGVWGREVRELQSDLRSRGLPDQVAVDEVNLSWRYTDGTPAHEGGWLDPVNGAWSNRRFFSAVNTVFLASVCGHVLRAGARVMPYATQDRALGLTVQAEYDGNPDGRPPQSPMPAYWGVAAWTGAGAFPHYGDRFFEVVRAEDSAPLVEVFAVANEAGGVNVVLIDKHDTGRRRVRVDVRGLPAGVFDCFRSDRDRPYEPFVRVATREAFRDGIDVEVSAETVTVLVLGA